MARRFTVPLFFVLLFSFLAIVTVAAPARAFTTYDFIAHGVVGSGLGGVGFSLKYIDQDGDGLFSLDELVAGSFSGFTPPGLPHYVTILAVPVTSDVSPLTDGGALPPRTAGYGWDFFIEAPSLEPGSHEDWPPPTYWTYTESAVPIPPSALLLGAGLIPLAWARRRK